MTYSDFSVLSGRRPTAGSLRRRPSSSGHHYDPNQPRVPAGHSDGGQWTSTGGAAPSRQDDEGVVSDATSDNEWKPGVQYAIRRAGGRGGSTPPTPGQLARLALADARERAAVRAVRERDPRWQPQPNFHETVEGRIAALQATAQEAEAYLAELVRNGIGPGPFARESIPARGSEREFTPAEREEINRIGYKYGCHTCGTKNPGTQSGNFIPDHQSPNAVNRIAGGQQRLYPHCAACSWRQARWLGRWVKGKR